MKLIKLAFLFFFFCFSASAGGGDEFSVYLGGGFSGFDYGSSYGERKFSGSGVAGLGYSHFITRHFGFKTGVEFLFHNSRLVLNDFTVDYVALDEDGCEFFFNSNINYYEEKHQTLMLQFPLMTEFRFGRSGFWRYYFSLGGKGAISLKSSFNGSLAVLNNSGYYPDDSYDYTVQEIFGRHAAYGDKGTMSLSVTAFVSADMGFRFKLQNGHYFYTGIFYDHGVVNMARNHVWTGASELIEIDSYYPARFSVNSVLKTKRNIVTKLTPFTAGLKFGVTFGRRQTGEVLPPVTASSLETAVSQPQMPLPIPLEQSVIYFENERGTILTQKARETLDEVYSTMLEYPEVLLEITGHSCTTGPDEFRLQLSQQRARLVADYLIGKGIPEERLVVKAMSIDRPLGDNETREGRAINRRAEIFYTR